MGQQLTGIDKHGVTSGRLDYRHPGRLDFLTKILDLLYAEVKVVEVKNLLQTN